MSGIRSWKQVSASLVTSFDMLISLIVICRPKWVKMGQMHQTDLAPRENWKIIICSAGWCINKNIIEAFAFEHKSSCRYFLYVWAASMLASMLHHHQWPCIRCWALLSDPSVLRVSSVLRYVRWLTRLTYWLSCPQCYVTFAGWHVWLTGCRVLGVRLTGCRVLSVTLRSPADLSDLLAVVSSVLDLLAVVSSLLRYARRLTCLTHWLSWPQCYVTFAGWLV